MKNKLINIVFILIITLANIFLIYPLFQGEFTHNLASIESQYFSHIKFITENFPRIWWQPFWYTGFPFYLFYQPVLPFALSLVRVLTGLPISSIYRFSIGIFYTLGGISLYLLLKDWTKKSFVSLLTALIYSIGPSVAAFIPVINGEINRYNFIPWRFIVLTEYGEGAHIWGLAMIPFCLIFFRRLLIKPTKANWIFSVGLTSLILLTSITAFMPLLVFMAILWFSHAVQERGKETFVDFLLVLLFSFGISSFWYNYSFLKAIFGFAQSGAGGIFHSFFVSPIVFLFIALPVFAVIVYFSGSYLKKNPNKTSLFIGLVCFVLFFLSIYFRYCCKFSLLPFPFDYIPRFGPEVELAFGLLLGVGLKEAETWFEKKTKRRMFFVKGLLFLPILSIILLFGFKAKNSAYILAAPHNNITSTSEYQVATWLNKNTQGERIYTTGTHGQWLNFFSYIPQLRGVADQAIINPLWLHVIYQIYWGEKGELAVNWLKALGIKYIVVNTGESKVAYKDFRFPGKFEKFALPVFKYQGDIIYELPTKKTKLVYKVPDNFIKMESINGVLEEEKLDNYLKDSEDSSDFETVWYEYSNPWDRLYVKGGAEAGKRLLIRISYHSGWSAFQGNKKLEIVKDPIGFMLIKPEKNSEEIVLKFTPTYDILIGYFITLATFIMFYLFVNNRRNEKMFRLR